MNPKLDDDILKQYGGRLKNDLISILSTEEDSEDEIKMFKNSHYYDWDGLLDILITRQGAFTTLSLNSQSIRAKFDKILCLVNFLQSKRCHLSAICTQETWLNDDDDVSLLQIPGYNLITQGKYVSEHGGLFIYLLEELNYTVRQTEKATTWEGLFIDIDHENLNEKLILGNIYRPPVRNNRNREINIFLDEFRPVLETILKVNRTPILAGDYNLDLLEVDQREKFQEFLDTMVSNGLHPKITLPTRFANKSCSLLDNIYTTYSSKHTADAISGILFSTVSDHFACFTSMDLFKTKKTSNTKFVKVYNHSASDIEHLCKE